MDTSLMQYCKCGCGNIIKPRSDGRQFSFKQGHKAGIKYLGVNDPTPTQCGYCHIPIIVERWRIEKFGICYCSRDHAKKQRSKNAIKTLTCEYCGKTFEMKPSRKRCKRIFCSLECFYKARKNSPDKKVDVFCSGCGKPMRVYPSKTLKNKNFYCSVDCRAIAIMGSNNPAFRSGWGRKREYSANWKKQRRAAIIRDGGKCRSCSHTPKKTRYLHVHHIIPAYKFNGNWEEANKLSNLITLCFTCHAKAEMGMIPIQPHLV